MFTTAIIGFREFLEAFLIAGVFLGVSRQLGLKKETEIGLAMLVGLSISLLLNIGVFFLGAETRSFITESNADAIESYLQIFAGIFLVYVIFSLHKRMNKNKKETLAKARENIKTNMFDVSLFFTIIFLVLREGIEIALFTSSISLFAVFMQNLLGLILGFVGAAILGTLTFFTYTKFSIAKVYKVTEYMIIILGASLFQTGLTKFFGTHFSLMLSDIGSFQVHFLPAENTFWGTLLQGFLGIDREFSMARLGIMVIYGAIVYLLFLQKGNLFQRISKRFD